MLNQEPEASSQVSGAGGQETWARAALHFLGHLPALGLMLCVQVYRWTLSPAKTLLLGPGSGCRFEPSCSAYALEALRTHGARSGTWLTLKRVCRCHPWGDCGHDPVPGGKSEARNPKSERVWSFAYRIPSGTVQPQPHGH